MNTYTVIISEQQRQVMQAALLYYISKEFNDEVDDMGNNVAWSLEDMLNPNGSTGALSTTSINGLVI